MRHYKQKRTLGRVRKQRTALLRGLARDLILRGTITTTLAKAKEVRPFVERLITKSKAGTIMSRRHVASQLGNAEDATKKLHEEVAPKYKSRPGGYTRITKLGRVGKRMAEDATIELV
jgi:large subunit ribosomal protein L17